jgi:hypothetical protein
MAMYFYFYQIPRLILLNQDKYKKVLYSKIIHVTCVIHGLHRVAEKVRSKFHAVHKVISSVKISLEKHFRQAVNLFLKWKRQT